MTRIISQNRWPAFAALCVVLLVLSLAIPGGRRSRCSVELRPGRRDTLSFATPAMKKLDRSLCRQIKVTLPKSGKKRRFGLGYFDADGDLVEVRTRLKKKRSKGISALLEGPDTFTFRTNRSGELVIRSEQPTAEPPNFLLLEYARRPGGQFELSAEHEIPTTLAMTESEQAALSSEENSGNSESAPRCKARRVVRELGDVCKANAEIAIESFRCSYDSLSTVVVFDQNNMESSRQYTYGCSVELICSASFTKPFNTPECTIPFRVEPVGGGEGPFTCDPSSVLFSGDRVFTPTEVFFVSVIKFGDRYCMTPGSGQGAFDNCYASFDEAERNLLSGELENRCLAMYEERVPDGSGIEDTLKGVCANRYNDVIKDTLPEKSFECASYTFPLCTATATPSATPTGVSTSHYPTATATVTPSSSVTSVSAPPTLTPTATATKDEGEEPTATPEPTDTPTATPSVAPSSTATAASNTATPAPTVTHSPNSTATSVATAQQSVTSGPLFTAQSTSTVRPTAFATRTVPPTQTARPSATSTTAATPTMNASQTPLSTVTVAVPTATDVPVNPLPPGITFTPVSTPTISMTSTPVPTVSPTAVNTYIVTFLPSPFSTDTPGAVSTAG